MALLVGLRVKGCAAFQLLVDLANRINPCLNVGRRVLSIRDISPRAIPANNAVCAQLTVTPSVRASYLSQVWCESWKAAQSCGWMPYTICTASEACRPSDLVNTQNCTYGKGAEVSQQSACKELHIAFLIDPDIAMWGVNIQSSLFSCRGSIISLFSY